MLTLIDYGVGNLRAFLNIYKQLNIPIKVARSVDDLDNTTKIILPGVGHFDYAMERFNDSGMKEQINKLVIKEEIPVIGICVGMQMMAAKSDEGQLPGLGWIDAEVRKFAVNQRSAATPLPHMGWNDIYPKSNNPIFTGLAESKFYFLHSYYFLCNNKEDSIAMADYSVKFTCVANHKNIYGIQFHPEKSHRYGVQLLKNFAELC